ncbi:MAG: glycogen debranching enzyme N-terminal domain-containing protein [Candidatus Aenigmarchaeota archaeon]|nr:glycogen debranching enzyme N-terminal domain-containing protein [Candidatus Aenigmarchaeota archaeon]
MKISFSKDFLKNLDEAKMVEWVTTDSTSSYASSTILGMNTSKYHGLLISSTNPPLDRKVYVSSLIEEIKIGEILFELSNNQYKDVIHPHGFNFLQKFEYNFFPTFAYKGDNFKIKKIVFMPRHSLTTVVLYEIKTALPSTFYIKPLIAFRSIYSLNKTIKKFVVKQNKKSVEVSDSQESVFFKIHGTPSNFYLENVEEDKKWYWNFFYSKDSLRGEDCVEHLYNPGCFEVKVNKKLSFAISMSLKKVTFDPFKILKKEIKRKQKLINNFYSFTKLGKNKLLDFLLLASDLHVIKRFDDQISVIAGYHWFGEWGRDTLISIPGMFILTKRFDELRKLFRFYLNLTEEGFIPTSFPVSSKDKFSYHGVDTSLWLFNSLYEYYSVTKDKSFIRKVWSSLLSIIDSYKKLMDEDCLIRHGKGKTWMDAKVDGFVTPREGKAVEIQALWYNALKIMETFAKELKKEKERKEFQRLSENVKKSFISKFWNGRYLNDREADSTIRPNQLIALYLNFSPIDDVKRIRILKTVEKELLSDFGIMTLPTNHKDFRDSYEGDQHQRDLAYHQGMVWPWLNGVYLISLSSHQPRKALQLWKKWTKKFLHEHGVGTVSELVEPRPPFKQKGCISQAWSIALLIESCVKIHKRIKQKKSK